MKKVGFILILLMSFSLVYALPQYNNRVSTTGGNTYINNTYINQTIINNGSSLSGGSDKKIVIWNGTNALTYDADLYFDSNVLYTPEINNNGPIYTDDLIFGGAIWTNDNKFYYDQQLLYTEHPIWINTSEVLAGTTDANFRLSSDDPYVASTFQVDGAYAKMEYGTTQAYATTGLTDQGNYQFYVSPWGQWVFGMLNDAKNAETQYMVFYRSGTTPVQAYFNFPALTNTGYIDANGGFAVSSTYGISDCYDSALGGQVCTTGGIVTSLTDHPSDKMFKDKIIPLTDDTSKFNQLKPSSWDWNISGKTGKSSGLVAQDLQTIYPNLVKEGKQTIFSHTINNTKLVEINTSTIIDKIKTKDNKTINIYKNETKIVNQSFIEPIYNETTYLTIDYAGVIALQIKKIQELEDRINALEQKDKARTLMETLIQ